MKILLLSTPLRLLAAVVVLAFLPTPSPAQVAPRSAATRDVHASGSDAPNYVVSVRELSIPQRARDAFADGSRLLAKTDFAASADKFQRAIAKYAGYYEAYFFLGIAEMNLDRAADAEKDFEKSLDLSGGNYAQPEFGLGQLLCDRGQFAEARAAIQHGLEIDGASWFGNYSYARALFGLGDLENAEKRALQALAAKADFAEAYLLLADVHSRENNSSRVLDDLDRYIALDRAAQTRAKAQAVRENLRKALSQETSAAVPPQ
jgi:tetratricopeptide (TPR) repeat protein